MLSHVYTFDNFKYLLNAYYILDSILSIGDRMIYTCIEQNPVHLKSEQKFANRVEWGRRMVTGKTGR